VFGTLHRLSVDDRRRRQQIAAAPHTGAITQRVANPPPHTRTDPRAKIAYTVVADGTSDGSCRHATPTRTT
jgi:hypothetical protein